MSYSYKNREASFVRDLDEAMDAWFKFRAQRGYLPYTDRQYWNDGTAFIDEFLHCRGWRLIPGSWEWV